MNGAGAFLKRCVSSTSVGIILLMLLAAALRFHDLDRTSLWFDEAISWRQASLPFLEMLAATAKDNYPPLHNIILHIVMGWFGDSETALRAPSALFGLINVYVNYRIGITLWDRKTGLLAALLLAIAGFHIWHSTEARMYSLLALCASLYVWTAIELAHRPAWWWFAGNLLSAGALLYSHIFGSVIFLSLNGFAFLLYWHGANWIQISWRSWLGVQFAAGLLFFPWGLIILQRFQEVKQGFWIPDATFFQVLRELARLMGGPVAAIVTCLLAGLAVIDVRKLPLPMRNWLAFDWQRILLIVWLVSPMIFAYSVSKISFPMFISRYLVGGLPSLYLLAACGLVNLDSNRATAKIAIALTLLVFAFPAGRYAFLQERIEDSRSAVRLLQQLRQPGEPLIYDQGWFSPIFEYYAPSDPRIFCQVTDLEAFSDVSLENERYWVLIKHSKWVDKSPDFDAALKTHEISSMHDFYGIQIYLFTRRGGEYVDGNHGNRGGK